MNSFCRANKTTPEDTATGAKGSDTVVFALESRNSDFPFVVNDYYLVIMQAKDGKADWKSGIGTGGYALKLFEPGVRIELERNPTYFKKGRAHFGSITILVIADNTASYDNIRPPFRGDFN